ncbi:hypothetical protein P3T76_009932 [Phytophthora citrophthora]|uniref:FAR1 domain-containing protein n=1 Tax=Phytophthora citrophthora TaxID=4793 RepID=A0AAD9GEP8_9STRA|nr:hypothetical protein P3T76_009932 [Phytophthora citrophthora]
MISRASNDHLSLELLPVLEPPEMWAPPPERVEFVSWEELEHYLGEYSAATYQSFRVRTNNKVAARNKKIEYSGSKQPLVPEAWGYYGKTFDCTHAGKYKSRGQGKRKRQEYRMLECDVQLAQLGAVGFCCSQLELSWFELGFLTIHRACEGRFEKKRRSILQFIQDNSTCTPTTQDIHNLVRKLKQQTHTASTSGKRLKQWMSGVHVLLAFQIFCGSEPLGVLNKRLYNTCAIGIYVCA